MYLARIPYFIKLFFPSSILWKVKIKDKKVFITFDDGPIPEVTPWVLEILKKYNAKATFFMVGENAAKYPNLVEDILTHGHRIGNHSFNHIKGWKTTDKEYYDNIEKAAGYIPSKLFRPPHGQIKPRQARYLKRFYKIIMWTILSGDYDASKTAEECFNNVKNNLSPGAIVVFHDSLKAKKNMEYALEESLKFLVNEGWEFGVIGPSAPFRMSRQD